MGKRKKQRKGEGALTLQIFQKSFQPEAEELVTMGGGATTMAALLCLHV